MSFSKKYRKLLRDPKLFFSDMLLKRKMKSRKKTLFKHVSSRHYTVVTSIYNSEKYLNCFFESLINQTLCFQRHITVICVDDGSTDNSANIIRTWVERYPENIQYFYQNNKGAASARNFGLSKTQAGWITFIDSDDFIDNDYFYNVDIEIDKENNLSLVSANVIYYKEAMDLYSDSHPLRFKYSLKKTIFNTNELNKEIQLSVASAFFKREEIGELVFNELLTSSFEDADFVGRYLCQLKEGRRIAFIKNAKYFYRKRLDMTSSMDNVLEDPNYYLLTLRHGCLSLLEHAENLGNGNIPVYIQNMVLYHLTPYFKRFTNYKDGFSFLGYSDKQEFLHLLSNIFDKLDDRVIFNFNLLGCQILYRVAFIEFFKKHIVPSRNVYIEKYDKHNNQILISFYSYYPVNLYCEVGGEAVSPIFGKKVQYDFLDVPIVYEYRQWIQISNTDLLHKKLFITLNNQPVRFILKSKLVKKEIDLSTVLSELSSSNIVNDTWLIMDRDIQADDNGEHFYRYILNSYPEREIYFALNETSHDWSRLEQDGFNLVKFGSYEFEKLLKSCSKIISSHSYATNYFGRDSLKSDFIFLQHGVTHNDQSAFFNTRSSLQKFVAATYPEYDAISKDNSHYKLSKKEVILTGFPRHDALLENNDKENKMLLIMPTWRRNIVGQTIGKGLQKAENTLFLETVYAKRWLSVLQSPILKELSDKFQYQIVFAPHVEVDKYLSILAIPDYIKIWKPSDSSIQDLFRSASFMLTDYSSVAFEMAYLEKQTVYYQFDIDSFYSEHYRKDYYDYEYHGFGPVVYQEDDLWRQISIAFANSGIPQSPYKERIFETFPFRDGKNSERLYKELIK